MTQSVQSIPFVALREQYDALKDRIDAAIAAVIARSAFVGGSEIAEFERWFADYCGVRYGVGVASGTTAIELALRALGVGPGDEVVTAANTFIASAAAISTIGARPVFVDVDDATGNIDPRHLDAAIGARTKAVLPIHLYGRPAAMREILDIAASRSVPMIEDAAQAHGTRYRGARVGSIGIAGCFSFYPTKNLGAFGDGGLLTTNDERIAAHVALLRDHGRTSKYEHSIVGYTARLDTLQAAVLRVQADRLDEWNARRREIARWYRESLPDAARPFADHPDDEAVYHLFVIRVPDRDALRARLQAVGVATAIHYPMPLHLQPAYRHLGYGPGDFPVTERLAAEVVSLPMHPFLRRDQVAFIGRVVTDFLREGGRP